MARTNYSKVEHALEEGLRKMSVTKLSDLADISAGIGHSKSEKQNSIEERQALIRMLKLDLMRLSKKDRKIFSKLGIKKDVLKEKLMNIDKITDKEWETLKKLREKTKKLIEEMYPQTSDEELIELQQERHINKRFNVNETWLPMK
ncbi:MAG: hypothetical protein VX777_03780 [Chlamydiota bacterium]|nr:hypothetical protein [Chlamydiota bacterium]